MKTLTPTPNKPRPTAETSVHKARLPADWTLDGVKVAEGDAEQREQALRVVELWL